MSADGAAAAKEETIAARDKLSKETRDRAAKVLTFGIFQAVLQNVTAMQSDVTLVSRALGGNEAATSRALATTNALAGVLGLFANQLGGKLSDAYGRKRFFLTGPIVNILCAWAVHKRSKSIVVLSLTKVLRSIFFTFSGSIMAAAAIADLFSDSAEMTTLHATNATVVGLAVVIGPYIESLALKLSKGNPVAPFKVMSVLASLQLLVYGMCLPETLAKRKELGKISVVISSMNPLTCLNIFRCKNHILRRLASTATFQMCVDGRVTSDLVQLWGRNNLKWTAAQMRDFVATWGAAATGGSFFVQPYLARTLSKYDYTIFTNACVGFGMFFRGISEKGFAMWCGLPFLLPGVNGGSARKVNALATQLAQKEGYGNGEFAAWMSNLRAFAQSVQIVLLGMWYARCRERGAYAGTAWFWAAFVAAGIPQLVMSTLSKADFDSCKE